VWRARWIDPYGKEQERSFARRIDAEDHLIEMEGDKRRGAYVDPAAGKIKLGPWAERWLNTKAAKAPSTLRVYRQVLDNQILPTFADTPPQGHRRAHGAGVDCRTGDIRLAGAVRPVPAPIRET
jgi:hypothetical protein